MGRRDASAVPLFLCLGGANLGTGNEERIYHWGRRKVVNEIWGEVREQAIRYEYRIACFVLYMLYLLRLNE